MQKIFSFFVIILFFLAAVGLPADDSVRVGASLSLSAGNTGPSGMIYNGYRLWVEEVNSAGGLLGRKVELIVYDDMGEPDKTAEYYRKLIEKDKVDLLLSPYGTPLTLIASEISEKAGMVMIASGAAGNILFERGFRFLFGMYAPADRFAIGFLDVCAREGYEDVAVVYENNVFNLDVFNGAVKWADKLGLEISPRLEIEPEAPDFRRAVDILRRENPDAVFVSAYESAGYEFISEMKAGSYFPHALCISIAPAHPDFYNKAGLSGDGIFAPSQWEPNERIPYPGTLDFVGSYKSVYNSEPSYHAGSAYAVCQLLAKGINTNGSFNQEELRDFISALDTVTVIGRFKVDPTGKQIGHNPVLIQWQDGRKEIVYPRTVKTSDPVFK